jgi:hypothetical protein
VRPACLQLQPTDADPIVLRIEKKNPVFDHLVIGKILYNLSPSLFFKRKEDLSILFILL